MIPLTLCTLTDGTTTLDLLDASRYALKEFDPVLAPLQESALASGGPYVTVAQPLKLDVFGDTPLRCWENAQKLVSLLDQGHQWNNDTPVNAVRHVVQTDWYATKVESLVLGQVGGDPFGGMSPQLDAAVPGSRYVLRDVEIAYRRTGVWEAAAEPNIDSSLVTNPGVMSVTFGSTNTNYSRLRLRGYTDGISQTFLKTVTPGVLILASTAAKIQVNDSTQFAKVTGPATVSTVADAGNIALGGSVIRTTAATGITKLRDALSFPTLKRRVAIFAAVRNVAANTFYMRAEVVDANENPNTTPTIPIETGTFPRIVYLGMVTGRYDRTPAAFCNLYISAASTNAAHNLDIDYVVLACLDDPWTDRVLTIGPVATSYLGTTINLPGDIVIEPGTSALRTPYPVVEVTLDDGVGNDNVSTLAYQGDPYLVAKGTELAACWLSTNGDAFWRVDFGGAAALRIGVQRARAYRLPPGQGEP